MSKVAQPSIRFLGAAGTVTGSRFLLSNGNTKVLIDCGMFQGMKELRLKNWAPFPVDPETIDAMVITHAHLDHSGFMPRLTKLGFRSPIFLTHFTGRLAEVILRDSARIQTEDAKYAAKKNFSKHNPPMALYEEQDVEHTLRLFQEQPFGERVKVADQTWVTFHPSGHILGAAYLEVEFFGKRLLFTGDMGRDDHPLLVAPGPVPSGHFDAIITESTYGDREHAPSTTNFEDAINQTVARGGSILIPAFAVDRTEVILVRLRELVEAGKIPPVPIYADSPMALKALAFYRQAIDERSPEIRPDISTEWNGRDPFDPGTLVELTSVEESKTVNNPTTPCIIISASGMGTGGRVVHHLRDMLPNPRHTVIMVGYQAIGTRGRSLVDGAEFVKMHGEMVGVKAQIEQIQSFSVHADSDELIAWISSGEKPGKVFVVHGEAGAAEVFSDRIKSQLGYASHVPHDGEEVSLMSASSGMRIEHDLLGNLEVPKGAYWGVHTARAVQNFPITGVPIGHYRSLIRALAMVKHAAAHANREVGILEPVLAGGIIQATDEIAAGSLDREFVVDAIQGGAGTSTNMNANEVIANRALELLGHEKGDYDYLHPLNHVNMSQSTNDVYPTAIKVGLILEINILLEAMDHLRKAFKLKSEEFSDVIKMGRTQLQDAVPMTLGQEFGTFARMIDEDEQRLLAVIPLLSEINLGGTAIGTQLNAPAGYAELACEKLSSLSGIKFVLAEDMVEATQDAGVFITVSGVLKRVAVKLSKMANDLRLLSSGPRAGLGEINLPPRQAGSSIMPGKVNPVIPEVVNQVAFAMVGYDMTVTMAVEAGQLQLNAFEPIITRALMMGITQLTQACLTFADNCVSGITANVDKMRTDVSNSIGLVTALSPIIGYENATMVAKQAAAQNASVKAVVLELGLMTEAEFDAVLGDVDKLVRPNG